MTQTLPEKPEYSEKRGTAAPADSSLAHIQAFESVDADILSKWDAENEQDPRFKLARLVLSNADPLESLKDRRAVIDDDKVFNVNLKGVNKDGAYPGPIVNQAASGRCWLFATTNVLRYNVVEQLNLGDFQLSQAYLFFYDKIEKANYYLETAIELADEPLDGRLWSFLNASPLSDGGQWDMAYNLVAKYGVIPHSLFPDSFSAAASSKFVGILTHKLLEYGLSLREAARPTTPGVEPASIETLRKLKTKYLAEVYSTLSITLGTPPKADEPFTWEYYNKEKKFNSWTGTPREFYAKYGIRKGLDPKDSFSLINDPRNEYGKHYTVKHLGNIWGAPRVKYVNAPTEVLEDAVIAGIKANTPLFFGCDVGKSLERKKGIMDLRVYDVEAGFGYKLGLNKADRLITRVSSATHAMVITAVHVDSNGRPVRYKVENSWSKTAGEDGWFMMTADWFREYVYQIVAPASLVDKKWADVLKQEAIELEAWDPMGALA
ncbi:bleomycin hydrolase [Vanrija albida]|uniref:Cysteine proteinase 1, mitochondrial n=1 Tax=Vanrija albida TaxID=181172 RepID=A0ABR3Q0H4_9TREE